LTVAHNAQCIILCTDLQQKADASLVCQQGALTKAIHPGNASGSDVYHFVQLHDAVAAGGVLEKC